LLIGIVSDVHGNAPALATALDRMGDVDLLLCAGDIVEEYRFDNETVALLRDRGAVCVLGNHDLGLLGPHGGRARSAEHVDSELVDWLGSHPTTHTLDIGGKSLLLTHASPCPPYTQYVMPGSVEVKRIASVEADYVVLGHTHRQMKQRMGRPFIINPGSVGQARDPHNGRRLSYAVLDTSDDRIEFDDFQSGDRISAVGRM
jgi:putative phosphoesterase